MSDFMRYVDELAEGIGPRPANTEEEHQAAESIAGWFAEGGVQADIEEFACPTASRWPYLVAYAVMFVSALLARVGGAVSVISFILSLLALGLFACERYVRPMFGSMFKRGLSQNVVARYTPADADGTLPRKTRKIVVLARYDSSHSSLESGRILGRFYPIIQKVLLGCMVIIPVLLLIQMFLRGSGSRTTVWGLALILSLVPLAGAIFLVVRRYVLGFPDGANDNASGVAAMLEVYDRVINMSSDEAEEAESELHGEDAAHEAGVVPSSARLRYLASGREDIEGGMRGDEMVPGALPEDAGIEQVPDVPGPAGEQDVIMREAEGYPAPIGAEVAPQSDLPSIDVIPEVVPAPADVPVQQLEPVQVAEPVEAPAPVPVEVPAEPVVETPSMGEVPPTEVPVQAEVAPVAEAAPVEGEPAGMQQDMPQRQHSRAEAVRAAALEASQPRPVGQRAKPSWWVNVENRKKNGSMQGTVKQPSEIRSRFADIPTLPQEETRRQRLEREEAMRRRYEAEMAAAAAAAAAERAALEQEQPAVPVDEGVSATDVAEVPVSIEPGAPAELVAAEPFDEKAYEFLAMNSGMTLEEYLESNGIVRPAPEVVAEPASEEPPAPERAAAPQPVEAAPVETGQVEEHPVMEAPAAEEPLQEAQAAQPMAEPDVAMRPEVEIPRPVSAPVASPVHPEAEPVTPPTPASVQDEPVARPKPVTPAPAPAPVPVERASHDDEVAEEQEPVVVVTRATDVVDDTDTPRYRSISPERRAARQRAEAEFDEDALPRQQHNAEELEHVIPVGEYPEDEAEETEGFYDDERFEEYEEEEYEEIPSWTQRVRSFFSRHLLGEEIPEDEEYAEEEMPLDEDVESDEEALPVDGEQAGPTRMPSQEVAEDTMKTDAMQPLELEPRHPDRREKPSREALRREAERTRRLSQQAADEKAAEEALAARAAEDARAEVEELTRQAIGAAEHTDILTEDEDAGISAAADEGLAPDGTAGEQVIADEQPAGDDVEAVPIGEENPEDVPVGEDAADDEAEPATALPKPPVTPKRPRRRVVYVDRETGSETVEYRDGAVPEEAVAEASAAATDSVPDQDSISRYDRAAVLQRRHRVPSVEDEMQEADREIQEGLVNSRRIPDVLDPEQPADAAAVEDEDMAAEDEVFTDDADDASASYGYGMDDFSAPEHAEVPTSLFGRLSRRFSRQKVEEREEWQSTEWLEDEQAGAFDDAEDEFGSWDELDSDGFESEAEDTEWKGGAASSRKRDPRGEDQMRARSRKARRRSGGPRKKLPKEYWFVALGASEEDNAGIKALLERHGEELRGATFINVRAVGTGELACVVQEGSGSAGADSDQRLLSKVRRAAKATGHEIGMRNFKEFRTDMVPARQEGHRAVTIMGFEGNAPAGWQQGDDTSDMIEERNIRAVAEILTELLRRI